MINIYLDNPKDQGKEVETVNDAFFITEFFGTNKEITADVIKLIEYIDRVQYLGDGYIKSSFTDFPIGIDCLSTGCKTAINALTFPNKIFDAAEMGSNALEGLFMTAKEANLYFSNNLPVLANYNVENDYRLHYLNGTVLDFSDYDTMLEEARR